MCGGVQENNLEQYWSRIYVSDPCYNISWIIQNLVSIMISWKTQWVFGSPEYVLIITVCTSDKVHYVPIISFFGHVYVRKWLKNKFIGISLCQMYRLLMSVYYIWLDSLHILRRGWQKIEIKACFICFCAAEISVTHTTEISVKCSAKADDSSYWHTI